MPLGIVPAVRPSKPLERGQTTIFNALNRGLMQQRPSRLGPAPKATGQANTVLGRQITRGANKKQIQELFASVCLRQSEDRELGDVDIVAGRFLEEDDAEEYEYILTRQY